MKDVKGDETIEIVFHSEPNQTHESISPAVYGSICAPQISERDFHERSICRFVSGAACNLIHRAIGSVAFSVQCYPLIAGLHR